MRKQDYLVGLIADLGPNEKRYFKLFSGLQPGEKRYLKLFDALENKKKYEAADLCAELGLESWQLADDKHYLTQILLQSLRNYDQESNEVTILRNSKENAQSLIARRMFAFASDIIEKTLTRAWELEAFELIDALLLQRSTCRQSITADYTNDDTLEQHERASAILKEVMQLMSLRGHTRNLEVNAADKKSFAKVLANPLLKCPVNKLKSLRAKSLRYEIFANYYSTIVDEPALLISAREERALYIKHPEIKIINPIVYLTNLLRLPIGETDYTIREQIITTLKKELDNPEIKITNQRRESILWAANLILLWDLRHTQRYKEALQLAEKMYAQVSGQFEFHLFSVLFEYALALLFNGKPQQAADKIDELLRFKSDIRADVQPFIRIMHLMVQLELGNYSIIPSIVKATRFWLKKKKAENPEMSLFLKHAGLIAKSPVDKRGAWRALLIDIETGKLPTITRLLQFDIWTKSMFKKARA